MDEKISTRSVAFINHADENWMFTKRKKRDLDAMERSEGLLSSENANKRLKLSEEIVGSSNVEIDKNGKNVFENKNEVTDTLKTRTDCRRQLTAENLKTVLRYVLANDSVLAMVQNTMKLQKDAKSRTNAEDLPESSEPKAKEFVKPPWPVLTPKKPDDVSKKLLEEEYSEESASDEDYQPTEEESNDEDASSSVKADGLNSSKVDEYILPDLKPPDQVSEDEDALVIALPEIDVCHDKEVEKIAERTRSKLCLNDTPLEAIESSFQPPDITIDMYDTHCDDIDWKEFLCEFVKPLNQGSSVRSVADETEDEKDPEYNVHEEEEEDEDEEEIDYDEIFGENPLGDEVVDLMTEILEFAQQDEGLTENDFSFLEELNKAYSGNEKNENDSEKQEIKNVSEEKKDENNSNVEHSSGDLETDGNAKDSFGKENTNHSLELEITESHSEDIPHSAEDTPSSPAHVEIVRKEWIIADERRQLDEQMRMYVQMLTQSYLLSHGFPSLHFINATSKLFLNEIKLFASLGVPNIKRSAFHAHNLDDAISIVNKFESLAEPKKGKSRKLIKMIPDYVKKVLASSKAFIYPELLPKNGFYTFFRGSKASFSTAEDNLIALGLEQFSYMEDPIQGVQKFLLPTKSAYQIQCRIKNSKQKKESENAITYFCKHKKLPKISRVIRIFDPNNVKAPEEYPPSALPAWMESYSNIVKQRNIEKQKSCQDKRPKLILPRIQIVPTFVQELNPRDPQGAPQPLICKVYSVNENNLSKGGPGIILPKRINRQRKRLAKNQVNKSTQWPESPNALSDSCISQPIKQELHSEGTSDEENVENDINSDSSSEYSINLRSPVHKKSYSLRKRNVVRSMSTNHETCQTESSSYSTTTEIIHPASVKEEPLSPETSDEECLENNSAAYTTHSETIKSRTLNNSSHEKQNQIQVEHSTLTEPSLRIVTSHGDESTDSEQSIAECIELLAPIEKFHCSIIEDAILPPASNSAQKHLPSDFSTIRDIICSEEKRKKLLNSDKTKVRSKKACKSKKNWTIDEDRLIISNCQRYGINKRAFRASADEIGELTPLKVKQRFIYLLKLLSEKLKNGK